MKHFVIGRTRNGHIQFFRYLFVGGSSSVVDLLIYGYLTEFLGVHYLLAALFSYLFGLVWNHTLCILWVFESRHDRLREFLMVFLISLGGLFWTELLLYLSVAIFGIHRFVARFIVLWIVLGWNFGMRKVYVFH